MSWKHVFHVKNNVLGVSETTSNVASKIRIQDGHKIQYVGYKYSTINFYNFPMSQKRVFCVRNNVQGL